MPSSELHLGDPSPQRPADPERFDRLAELALLAAGHLVDDPTYGATKLNKALFFSDMLHFKRHGTPISGAVYERLPRSPAPREILGVRRSLVASGAATIEGRGYLGYVQRRLVPRRPARSEHFGPTELQMVEEVCRSVRGHSHANVLGWQLASEREEIPYESAFLSSAAPTLDDLRRGAAIAADRGLRGPARRPGSPPTGQAGPLSAERYLRTITYECSLNALRSCYPRIEEVLAGTAWACARWPEGVHRIPGTRLAALKTEWPVPALRVFFSLPDDHRCVVWAIDQTDPYAEEEDGTD